MTWVFSFYLTGFVSAPIKMRLQYKKYPPEKQAEFEEPV
jgi:hypothetical protein